MCLVSQRKRERAAATEVPGDFNGGEGIGPMAMGFNPMMNPTHGMMAQACTHCMLLIRLGNALLELAIGGAAAQGFSLLCSHPALCVPGSCVQEVVKEILRLAPRPDKRQRLSGTAACAAQAPCWPQQAWPGCLAASAKADKRACGV